VRTAETLLETKAENRTAMQRLMPAGLTRAVSIICCPDGAAFVGAAAAAPAVAMVLAAQSATHHSTSEAAAQEQHKAQTSQICSGQNTGVHLVLKSHAQGNEAGSSDKPGVEVHRNGLSRHIPGGSELGLRGCDRRAAERGRATHEAGLRGKGRRARGGCHDGQGSNGGAHNSLPYFAILRPKPLRKMPSEDIKEYESKKGNSSPTFWKY